jgi:hypothetical protein
VGLRRESGFVGIERLVDALARSEARKKRRRLCGGRGRTLVDGNPAKAAAEGASVAGERRGLTLRR